MKNKHNIETYSRLETAAEYFLKSSFISLSNALKEETFAAIYQQELMKIEVTETDKNNFKNAELPSNAVDLLQSKAKFTVKGRLMNELLEAGYEADKRAEKERIKIKKNQKLNSIEILGHLNNFGFFIETIINRHFLFLQHKNEIDNISYNRIAVAKIMERIIYLFKEELNKNKIQINEIKHLFSLRNKTVHFTPDNAKSLNIDLGELCQIWNQTIKILKNLENKEQFNENKFSERLNNRILDFQDKWT